MLWRSSIVILRQTSCVMFVSVCMHACMCVWISETVAAWTWNTQLSHLHIQQKAERLHTTGCARAHTHTRRHILTAPTFLWNCRPPAEKLKHTSWGGDGGDVGWGIRRGGGCWLWRRMRLVVSDIETKVKHKRSAALSCRPHSKRSGTKRRRLAQSHDSCSRGTAPASAADC